MVQLGREHIEHIVGRNQSLAARNQSLLERVDALKQKLTGAMTASAERLARPGNGAHVVRTLEVNAAAFVGGLWQGKAGPDGYQVLGVVPPEACVGLGLSALGYFGVGGDHVAEHMINLGDGLLSSFATSVGFNMGSHWRTGGNESPALAAAPSAPAVKGEISPQQMADIVARIRRAPAMHS